MEPSLTGWLCFRWMFSGMENEHAGRLAKKMAKICFGDRIDDLSAPLTYVPRRGYRRLYQDLRQIRSSAVSSRSLYLRRPNGFGRSYRRYQPVFAPSLCSFRKLLATSSTQAKIDLGCHAHQGAAPIEQEQLAPTLAHRNKSLNNRNSS